jgi:hypothetical protein
MDNSLVCNFQRGGGAAEMSKLVGKSTMLLGEVYD